jgi:hypothetical protein
VCDGQAFGDEPIDRGLPCWNNDPQGACRVTTRHCSDQNGVAYTEECNVDSTNTMLPTDTALCTRYRACQQTACGDVIGCVRGMFTQFANIKCILPIDPTSAPGQPIRPCSGGSWTAPLPLATGTSNVCLAAMLDGVQQPPFHLGLVVAGKTVGQTLATTCPNSLIIDKIDAPYPDAVLDKTFDLVSGEHLAHVTLSIVRQCSDAQKSLVCSSM